MSARHAHHEDFGHEPVRGLPQLLPAGERILWQGRPEWLPFARHAFRLVPIGVYFALLAAWRLAAALEDGMAVPEVAEAALWPVALGGLVIVAAGLVGRYAARTTLYTITDRRVVFRIGMALTVSVNLPFAVIGAAALRRHRDGTGDITLSVMRPARASWVMFWPHTRPWRIRTPQPMLRNLAEPEKVAQILARALAAASAMPAPALLADRADAPAPRGEPVAA